MCVCNCCCECVDKSLMAVLEDCVTSSFNGAEDEVADAGVLSGGLNGRPL